MLFSTISGTHFYPRSPCGERPILGNPCAGCPAISIHALLAESDTRRATGTAGSLAISIHALLAESDSAATQGRANAARFLSTLSLRRATYPAASCRPRGGDFYPRSPCGERPIDKSGKNGYDNFYPRSPCGERRMQANFIASILDISIHALLAESDRILCK